MSTISELSIGASAFALGETLDAIPAATFDIERVVAHEADRVMPFVWAIAPDRDALEAAFADDPSVATVERLSDLDDEWLYRMEWVAQVQFVVHALTEEGATVLNAQTDGGRWQLRVLFPDRDALSHTYGFCEDHDLDLDIETIYEMNTERHGRFGLTDDQSATLTTAFERGFYEVPREISVAGLADELDISHQALSERFRRAHGTLIENSLVIGRERDGARAATEM